jgi:hypothetical protein
MARNKDLSFETHQSILVLRNEAYSMQEIAKKQKITEQRKLKGEDMLSGETVFSTRFDQVITSKM